MSQPDSGVKFLFAGLLLVIALIVIALFWRPFQIWVGYHQPRSISVEDVARDRAPAGAQVRVEGILDPRHVCVVKEPGGERLLEISLLLADDLPMRQWRDAIERDARLFRDHLGPALDGELERRGVQDYMNAVDAYQQRWDSSAARLATTIRDAWPNYAVGVARVCDDCTETGFRKRVDPGRGWIIEGFEPRGGIAQRPPWPDDIVLSNPIKAAEIPVLRKYLDDEAAYYRGAAQQVSAELDALAPERSFGAVVSVVGTIHKMPTEAFDAFEAIDDLLFDTYFFVREGEEPTRIGLAIVPPAILVALAMLALMGRWALAGRRRYEIDD